MAWATAIIARCFPRRAASQRKSGARYVPLVGVALWANGTSPVRSARFPWRVVPERRFPALASWPGATPAYAARRAAVPKRRISVPISATSMSAPRRSTPGMVSRRVIAWSKGKGAAASMCGARPTAGHEAARQEYVCHADAEAAAKLRALQSAYHWVEVGVEERPTYGPGRPSSKQPRVVKALRYGLQITLHARAEVIARKRQETGCFVLLSGVSANPL
jgi:hypothetical protein